jgi:hypothetical protein
VATNDMDAAFDRWRRALADAMGSADNLMAWQDRRYKFAHKVGQLLTSAAPQGSPVTDHVVYGVWVIGAGLIYVGQTEDAKRRLRDLPVGESHHLATTVPPETWERVIVVQWPSLLSQIPAEEARAAEQLGPSICNLAIEHLLQVAYRPVMNARRRSTDGNWNARDIDSSRSRGAVASSQLAELFGKVCAQWDTLASAHKSQSKEGVIYSDAGRAVFPGSL